MGLVGMGSGAKVMLEKLDFGGSGSGLMSTVKRTIPVCGNVNWCSHYGKQYGGFSKNLKIELSYDPAIPLLGRYQRKRKQ